MSDDDAALKKIEERHGVKERPDADPDWGGPECRFCGCECCGPKSHPCAAVKLAGALDKARRRLLLIAGVLDTEERRTVVVQYSDEAERTLEEVAGE